MNITEVAIEDCKYKEAIDLSMRLDRALYKTVDIDATLMLMRAPDTNYIGGDGVSLVNTALSLPMSGSFSNTLATPMSPSTELINTVFATLAQMPGHDGQIEGYEIEKVVYPPAQHFAWLETLGSKLRPDSGNFAAINIANSAQGAVDITPVMNKYWTNTTTNSAFITNAENGLQFKWRVKPKGRSWVDNSATMMKFAIRARWARKWSDPRGFFFNAA
jgi:hypothetical protein